MKDCLQMSERKQTDLLYGLMQETIRGLFPKLYTSDSTSHPPLHPNMYDRYLYIYIYRYIHMFIHVHTYIHTYRHTYVRTHIHVHTYTNTYVIQATSTSNLQQSPRTACLSPTANLCLGLRYLQTNSYPSDLKAGPTSPNINSLRPCVV